MTTINRNTIIEIISVLNIMIFLYSGIAKIIDYAVFKEQLAVNPILSPVAKPVALLLPVLEFLIVLMLVFPRWRQKGLITSLGLMTIFTVYIIALFSISKEMPCSCGGLIDLLSWQQHLIFNGIFMLLDALAIRLLRKVKKSISKDWQESTNYQVTQG